MFEKSRTHLTTTQQQTSIIHSQMEMSAATTMHELIFIPGPGMGHVVAAVELANLIITRHSSFFITFFLIKDPQVHNYTKSLHTKATPRLKFINLPEAANSNSYPNTGPRSSLERIERHKPHVKEAAIDIVESNPDRVVAGFVVDMFCLTMTDIANDLNIPTYVFFTSGAAFLSLKLHVQEIYDEHNIDVTDYKDSHEEFLVPGFSNRVPAKVLPSMMLDKNGGFSSVVATARRIRETKGILINTFDKLESRAVESLTNNSHEQHIPPIYSVGPILNSNHQPELGEQEIIGWLDNQPASSVVFLCFGSLGSFNTKQTREIAVALEQSGQRFLWSLRQRSSVVDNNEALPTGFLERTSGFGKVIGWAPQLAVLSHTAVGGFVSHCGWNSVLESLRFGVPMAAWPMYAEQQVNAFEIIIELGIAIEIKVDYREEMGDTIVVSSEEIVRGIKRLMMEKDEYGIRDKVNYLKEKSEKAMGQGGSSYNNLGRLIHDIMQKSPTLKC